MCGAPCYVDGRHPDPEPPQQESRIRRERLRDDLVGGVAAPPSDAQARIPGCHSLAMQAPAGLGRVRLLLETVRPNNPPLAARAQAIPRRALANVVGPRFDRQAA